MRAYLAMQAAESGKGFGGAFLGRTGLVPYGQGNMLLGGEQGGQGKVCEYSPLSTFPPLRSSITDPIRRGVDESLSTQSLTRKSQ